MSQRSVPLLLAVHECVGQRAQSPANGGSPVIWPKVVDALVHLQPDAGWTDSTARKAYRNVRGLGPAERRNLIETVDEQGPFGAKGLGESGVIPVSAAIANAVKDATGVRFTELPMTPQRVYQALEAAHSAERAPRHVDSSTFGRVVSGASRDLLEDQRVRTAYLGLRPPTEGAREGE